jgi:hypothetical protein
MPGGYLATFNRPRPLHRRKRQQLAGRRSGLERFLPGYWYARTRGNYRFILAGWAGWCEQHGHDVLAVDAAVLEAWVAPMKTANDASNTIGGRVSTV